MQGFVADFLFYVAVVGDVCDNSCATKANLIKELCSVTSLSDAEALEVVDTMITAGKLVLKPDQTYDCTLKA